MFKSSRIRKIMRTVFMSVNYRYLVSFLVVELYSLQVPSNNFEFYEIMS